MKQSEKEVLPMSLSKIKRKRSILKIALLIILASVTSGCTKKVIYEIESDSWCTVFDPIYGHRKDTEGTKKQLEVYMDLYNHFCKDSKNKG